MVNKSKDFRVPYYNVIGSHYNVIGSPEFKCNLQIFLSNDADANIAPFGWKRAEYISPYIA